MTFTLNIYTGEVNAAVVTLSHSYEAVVTAPTYTTDDLVADENGNLFLEFDKLRAIMLGEKITATIWDGDTQISRTVEYSAYTYVQKNQNTSNTAVRELLQAIYNYGESAKKA